MHEAKDFILDASSVHWLDCSVEKIFQCNFHYHNLIKIISYLEVLPFCFKAFILIGKGGLNNIGPSVHGVDLGGVGVCGIDFGRHDHAPPSTAGKNCSCILLTMLVEHSNVGIASPRMPHRVALGEAARALAVVKVLLIFAEKTLKRLLS